MEQKIEIKEMNAEQRFSLLVMKVNYYKNQVAFDIVGNYECSLEYDMKQLKQHYRILDNTCKMKGKMRAILYLL